MILAKVTGTVVTTISHGHYNQTRYHGIFAPRAWRTSATWFT